MKDQKMSASTKATARTSRTAQTAASGTATTGASQTLATSEEKKPLTNTTATCSNSDEVIYQNDINSNKDERKKIKNNYFFTVAYHLALWITIAAICSPFFWYYGKESSTGYPAYYGYGSLIGHYPKLNLMVPEGAYNEKDGFIHIKFKRDDHKTWDHFWKFYETNSSVRLYYDLKGEDCFNYDINDPNVKKPNQTSFFCDALLNDENGTQNWYGECYESKMKDLFEHGRPCFMLKFNKILDYIPHIKTRENCVATPGCCDDVRVKIVCNGTQYVNVFPQNGTSICQWPYKGKIQEGYHPPMAMLQIIKMPTQSTAIHCYAETDDEDIKDKHDFFTTGPHTLTFILDPWS